MGNLNSEAIRIYGARIIHKHLNAIREEIGGVREGENIEYIHRMRVASRRMRIALGLFKGNFPKQEYKVIKKDIRKVTQALGAARDLDVQLALLAELTPQYSLQRLIPGIRRLQLRLEQQRSEAQKQVDSAMDDLSKDHTLEEIETSVLPYLKSSGTVYLFSPALYELAFTGIKSSLDDLLAQEPYIHDEAKIAELHKMRIAAKHLRYTLETFENLYGSQLKPFIIQTRKIQDLLGIIHDNDVWIMLIPKFIEEERERIRVYFGHDRPVNRLLPGLESFRQGRIETRKAKYQEFILKWDQIVTEGVWEKLIKLINTPLDLEAAMQFLSEQGFELTQADSSEQADNLEETDD